jgi:hypothetical protein
MNHYNDYIEDIICLIELGHSFTYICELLELEYNMTQLALMKNKEIKKLYRKTTLAEKHIVDNEVLMWEVREQMEKNKLKTSGGQNGIYPPIRCEDHISEDIIKNVKIDESEFTLKELMKRYNLSRSEVLRIILN